MTANWVSEMPTAETFAINRILYEVQHKREEERRYFDDPHAYIANFTGLTPRAVDALARNDIGQLYLLGANPYLLRAYCLQLRVPERDYLAALRAVGKVNDDE
jgi:protocatechuate 4,5-dioxygenase alpha chain